MDSVAQRVLSITVLRTSFVLVTDVGIGFLITGQSKEFSRQNKLSRVSCLIPAAVDVFIFVAVLVLDVVVVFGVVLLGVSGVG